jgi:hypothetical protein
MRHSIPPTPQTDGPWFAITDPNWTHADAADTFYLARLFQIVATQVTWLNSGMGRSKVERWGAESVALAKQQLIADEQLDRLSKQIEEAMG